MIDQQHREIVVQQILDLINKSADQTSKKKKRISMVDFMQSRSKNALMLSKCFM